MARAIINPIEMRRRAVERPKIDKAAQDAQAAMAARKTQTAKALAAAFKPLTKRDQAIIRRNVALSLPDKPMSREECQLWLDERCIGVARYMHSGRIT